MEGDAILLARRFSLAELGRKFSIGWFLPVILRFKRHLGEVFVGSFFLQTFGLITPLFSQVIIDKVLIHKGLSTLDVLMLGLFLINIFEMILGVTRTYLFSHTTNRVDVILGAKLFKHLLALPLPYFEARTVGTTIARVRELETIAGPRPRGGRGPRRRHQASLRIRAHRHLPDMQKSPLTKASTTSRLRARPHSL